MAERRLCPITLCYAMGGVTLFVLLAGGGQATLPSAAAQPPSPPQTSARAIADPAWIDRDGDGRHDLFQDVEGDGVNDVTKLPYAHDFSWSDLNNDGLNDWFRDADGDGVNDLETIYRDRDGDGRDDNVLDADGDGRNDVTGLQYAPGKLEGQRYGFVREGEPAAAWIDEDGDGFPDSPEHGQRGRGREDRFIDRDGDGMADDCWFQDGGFRHHRARTGGGGQGGSGHGGGGQDRGRP